MIKLIYEVTLRYADETTWFAGAFPSMEAANAWVENERSMPYWQPSTQVSIKEIELVESAPIIIGGS